MIRDREKPGATRAEALCHSLNRPLLLYVALLGQWYYSLLTDKLSATMRVAKQLYSLATGRNDSAQNDSSLPRFGRDHHFLGDSHSARKFAMSGIKIWRSGRVQSHKQDLGL
jgi:hypothetical protein